MAICHIQPYSLNFRPFYKTQTKWKTYWQSRSDSKRSNKNNIWQKYYHCWDPPPPKKKKTKQMSVPIHKLDGSFLIFISHPFQWTYLVLVAKVRKLSSKSNIANLAVVAVVPVWGSIYKAHIEVIDEEGKTDLLVASQSSANSTAFTIKKKEVLALLELLKHFLSITYLDWIFNHMEKMHLKFTYSWGNVPKQWTVSVPLEG